MLVSPALTGVRLGSNPQPVSKIASMLGCIVGRGQAGDVDTIVARPRALAALLDAPKYRPYRLSAWRRTRPSKTGCAAISDDPDLTACGSPRRPAVPAGCWIPSAMRKPGGRMP